MARMVTSAIVIMALCFHASVCAEALASSAYLISCPQDILVRETATSAPIDWQSRQAEGSHRVRSVGLFDGLPAEGASLKPTFSDVRKGRGTVTWRFDSAAVEVWIECRYANTEVTLMQRVSQPVTECIATYRGEHAAPALMPIRCK